MSIINLVQGDTLPSLNVTLKDSNTGELNDPDSWDPIDLSDGTTSINLLFRAKGSTTLLETIPFVKVDGGSTGQITLDWTASALANDVGRYEGQIEIDYNGSKQTVVEELEFKINESFN